MKCLCLLIISSFAKHFTTTISLSAKEPWAYITKFAMNIGKGSYNMKVQLLSPEAPESQDFILFHTSIYLDSKWSEVVYLPTCEEKEISSSKDTVIQVPLNGEWSNTIDGFLNQNVKTRFWYFTICRCDLKEKYKLYIDIELINSDGSEFSAEDHGLQYVYPVILMVYFGFLFSNMFQIVMRFENHEEISMNLVILNGAILTQFVGILFQVVHLWIFWYNGRGVFVFDIMQQALQVVSSIIISVLFILIASGWTIKYRGFPEADIYIPISMIIIAINLVIVAAGKLSGEAYNKYTDYEGISALFIVLLRVLSWAWFMVSISGLNQDANLRLTDFLSKFTIVASVYFLSLPAIIAVSWLFEAYVRKKLICLLLNLVQVLVFYYTSHLFSNKSQFYKVSTLSQSVLPGINRYS